MIRATPRPPPSKPSRSPRPDAEHSGGRLRRRPAREPHRRRREELDDLRRAWLNPPDLVDIVPEVTPTAAPGEAPRRYPDRILPKNVEAAVKLKERTLTNLYNQRPRWLADAHDALDRAVAAAYGWPEDIATDDALRACWRSISNGRRLRDRAGSGLLRADKCLCKSELRVTNIPLIGIQPKRRRRSAHGRRCGMGRDVGPQPETAPEFFYGNRP